MAPPGMPNTISTPSRSSAATSAWAPVIWTGPLAGSWSAGGGPAPGAASRPAASRAGARAARSRGDGAWPGRAGPVGPVREPTAVVVWSVMPMFPSSALVTRTLATKNPSCPGQSGWRADYRTSEIRAPSKYENVVTVHVVHCGPWGCIRQPESSFVSEYETKGPDAPACSCRTRLRRRGGFRRSGLLVIGASRIAGAEHLDPPAPGRLGPGQRGLGVAPHVRRRAAVGERGPHACRDAQIRVPYPERLRGHAPRQPFGDIRESRGADRAFGQYRELIAAPARDRVLRRHR